MGPNKAKAWKFNILFVVVFLLLTYVLLIASATKVISSIQPEHAPLKVDSAQLVKTSQYDKIFTSLLLQPNSYSYQNQVFLSVGQVSNKVGLYPLESLFFNVIADMVIPFIALFIMALTSVSINAVFLTKKLNKALTPISQQVNEIIGSYDQHNALNQVNADNVDVHQLRQALEKIKQLSAQYRVNAEENIFCDKLTKLIDRYNFLDHIEKQLKITAEKKQKSGLLFIDLDGFKQVNDSYGHSFGDEVLIQVAERLRSVVRRQKLNFEQDESKLEQNLSRLGGDEFTIYIQNLTSSEQAIEVAMHVLQELERDFILGNKTIKIGASIGIAIYPDSAATPNALIQMADVAMYRAKTDGRGIYRIYSPEMGANMRRYHYLLDEMRLALDSGSFFLTFQPVINVDGCHVSYFEALTRWQHPVEGTIGPDEFIPIAESSNLILELGDWILAEACRQMSAWYNAGMRNARISVNVSAIQLKYKPLYEWVMSILQKSGLPATSLMLEVTESCFIEASGDVISEFEKLRAEGVMIAIDDFGTGFSSLSVLANLPIDVLKIDKLFISQAMNNKKYNKILHSIVEMAEKLDLKVVAEGIEQLDQLELLKSLGVKYIQGYFISRPQPSAAVGEKLFKQGANQMAQTGTSPWLPQSY